MAPLDSSEPLDDLSVLKLAFERRLRSLKKEGILPANAIASRTGQVYDGKKITSQRKPITAMFYVISVVGSAKGRVQKRAARSVEARARRGAKGIASNR